MSVFQITRTTNMSMEDYRIGFEKVWIYVKHDDGGYARYPGKNHRCP